MVGERGRPVIVVGTCSFDIKEALWREISHATSSTPYRKEPAIAAALIPPFPSMTASVDVILFSLLLALPAAYYIQSWIAFKPEDSPLSSPTTTTATVPDTKSALASEKEKQDSETTEKKPVMQSERTDLAPPKDDKYTLEELKQYDGNDPAKPIYVAIKGMYSSGFVMRSPWRAQVSIRLHFIT